MSEPPQTAIPESLLLEPPPGSQRGPLSAHERDAVARMAGWGMPTPLIAAAIGRSDQTVRKLLANDADIAARREAFQARLLREAVHHGAEMIEGVSRARETIRLLMGDEQKAEVRLKAAEWWVDHTPGIAELGRGDSHTRVEVGLDGPTAGVITEAIAGITGMIETLGGGGTAGAYLLRVRTGPDALPGPPTLSPDDPGKPSNGGSE